MNQAPHILGRYHELLPVDAEDAVLPVVPEAIAARFVPIPRAHVAGHQRKASSLLALCGADRVEASSSAVRADTRCSSSALTRSSCRGLAVELGKDLDLGPQHFRHHRHRHVIHRAHLVAAQAIDVGQMDGGDEDHRRLLEARMLADHRGELEAVELRHADVHEDHGDIRLQEVLQRLPA